jgi:glycosyltransferase involved in cell wall biosynthesis
LTTPPLVTVVVPSLNRRPFLRATLESILSQDDARIQCIVVDGGSTDGTIALLEGYKERVQCLHEVEGGPAAAIERGWREAVGDYLCWLNADDVWLPGAVATAVQRFVADPDLDIVYGACGAIDLQGRQRWVEAPARWDLDRAILKLDTIIHQPAAFMTKRIIDRVGGLTNDWCHDHDLWIRAALAGAQFGTTPVHLANCRVWPGDAHSDPGLMLPAMLRLVERTFANPALPERLRGRATEARANAYIRFIDYLAVGRPSHWALALSLAARAVASRPAGAPALLAETFGKLPRAGRRLYDEFAARARPPTAWAIDSL